MLATVSGETQAVAQLLVEMSEMIKAKRLVPLAVLSDKPITLEGFGEIAPTTKWLPNMPAPMNYFGIWCAKGTPDNVVKTMAQVWEKKIKNSEALKKYANARSALFAPLHGDEAEQKSFKMVRYSAWLYFDGGKAKVSPDTLGIPRPVSASRTQSTAGPRPGRFAPLRMRWTHRHGRRHVEHPPARAARCRRARICGRRRFLACWALAIVVLAWRMPTFTEQKGEIYTAPGLVPGLLRPRHLRAQHLARRAAVRRGALRAGGRRGRRPAGRDEQPAPGARRRARPRLLRRPDRAHAVLAGGGYLRHRVHRLFEWRAGEPWAPRAQRLGTALLQGVVTGVAVVLVFEKVFYVRLP